MTHNTTWSNIDSPNESRDRFWVRRPFPVLLDPFRSVKLGGATNLTNEYNTFSIMIMLKNLEGIDKISASNNISSHPYT